MAEYGRHVQDMVQHALTITNREQRNKAARTIISVMNVLHPSFREVEELQQKLWADLIIMSGYKLDVDMPYEAPLPKTGEAPTKVAYPAQNFRYRHYGKIIESLIESAIAMKDPAEQQELAQQIANLMKKSYLTFNRDSVNDEMIVEQLSAMSGGKLKLSPDFRFQLTTDILLKNRKPPQNLKHGKNRNKRRWKKH